MKKILSFLAAVLIVAATQASTVSWAADYFDAEDGWTVNVYNGDITSAITSWQNKSLDIDAISSGVGSGVVSSGAMDFGYAAGQFAGTIEPTITAVIFSSVVDGGTFYYATTSTAGKTYDPPSPKPGTATFDSFSSGTFAAVPEPCAVALLALGLAAFGLKRKVQM